MPGMNRVDRREFLRVGGRMVIGGSLAAAASGCAYPPHLPPPEARPNVILVMTDDQGYGDLGHHGNDRIRTPNLDRLARQSAEMTQFYVCPVCSPTRASLMSGRYHYRTGVVDTYLGRSMVHADEMTIAEWLRKTGYPVKKLADIGDFILEPLSAGWHGMANSFQ